MKTEVFTPRRRKNGGRHGPHEARGPCDADRLRLLVKIPRRQLRLAALRQGATSTSLPANLIAGISTSCTTTLTQSLRRSLGTAVTVTLSVYKTVL